MQVQLTIDDGVGTIRLDRPPMNALDRSVQDQIAEAAREAAADATVAAVVVHGGDQVFAAGADVKEMAGLTYADMAAASHAITDSLDAVARIGKPTVAAINGYALGGGCELALACDRRVAATNAKLGQPEIRLGLIPGAGGTQRLPRLVGPSVAKDLIYTGRQVDATEADRIGLVDEVVDEPYRRAVEWARQFVDGPPLALAAAKSAIDRGLDVDLDTGRELERQQFAGLFATEDATTGMTAFTNKQAARFVGR